MKKLVLFMLFAFMASAYSGIVLEVQKVRTYSDMHIHDNVAASIVSTADTPHLVYGKFAQESMKGISFEAGSTGSITVFADAGGGQVTVTSATHGLSNGDIISIAGTTSYNGVFSVANVATNTYEITDTWVANDATGSWNEGDKLIFNPGATGIYKLDFSLYGSSAGSNQTYEFTMYKNATKIETVECKRKFIAGGDIGMASSTSIVTFAEGDSLTFAYIGIGTTSSFTFEHANVVVHSVE